VLAGLSLVGALYVYIWALVSVESDDPLMDGDQSVAANYAPAIILAVIGGFLILVGVILIAGAQRNEK
jgi:hypothetical protein